MFDYVSALEAGRAGLGAVLFDTSLHGLQDLGSEMTALTDWLLDDPPLGYAAIEPPDGNEDRRLVLERLGIRDAAG